MTVRVHAHDEADEAPPEPFPAVPLAISEPSPLEGLKAKLAEKRETLTRDFEVPRWLELMGFRVFLRCKALSPVRASAIVERFAKAKSDEWALDADAQMIADCCLAVFALDPNRPDVTLSLREGDPDGPLTKIDHELAKTLGAPTVEQGGSVVKTCRALFFTDGVLIATVGAIAEWSSEASESVDFTKPSGATSG